MKLILEQAKPEQVNAICDLVNVAYRGEDGWTKETGIVSGDRSSSSEILGHLANPKGHFLVADINDEIRACVYIEEQGDQAYIGLLVVHPSLQGAGVGKELLSLAEAYAVRKLKAKKFVMVVVSQRPELIEYYERRGYMRSGKVEAYPTHLEVGDPLVDGLTMDYLEKPA
jgi:ribosomal protein S18 acetylase RimI-like enzyme